MIPQQSSKTHHRNISLITTEHVQVQQISPLYEADENVGNNDYKRYEVLFDRDIPWDQKNRISTKNNNLNLTKNRQKVFKFHFKESKYKG